MPRTVNGIGTHYYGKKNVNTRTGVCQACHREGQLDSYDTRLWIVVVFVPLIPIGRKRIIDYCRFCRRHFVMDLDKWEDSKQLEISGALEKYRASPTPETAIEVHLRLLRFHQYKEAETFRQTMQQQFADNAKIQLHLGGVLEQLRQFAAADPFFARALELRPDLPEARIGVAMTKIRAGKLVDARQLLDFLEKPGAAQLYSLAPLELLGNAYQKAGQHPVALEIYGKILAALPAVAQNVAFRKKLAVSEKAIGQRQSILPKKVFTWKGLFQSGPTVGRGRFRFSAGTFVVLGIIAAVIGVGLLIGNEYVRRHRTLYIVADFPSPVRVEVPGAEPVTLSKGMRQIILPEGRHHARVTGSAQEEVDFEMRANYWDRWSDHPAWVLNAGASAILMQETAVYKMDPPPAEYSFHFGKTFEYFPEVSNPFAPLPHSVQSENSEPRTLQTLDLLKGEPAGLFDYFFEDQQFDRALQLAEMRLRIQPDDEKMLGRYRELCQLQKLDARFEQLLRSRLGKRPVLIQWHRYYQDIFQYRRQTKQLIPEYDAMLAAEPTNSALLYLRGRLAANRTEGRSLFERARQADPKNPYPVFGLAYNHAADGDWAGARTLTARAVELRPGQADFSELFFKCRLASGEYSPLETELLGQLARTPVDVSSTIRLTDVFAVQHKTNAASHLVAGFEKALLASGAPAKEIARLTGYTRTHLFYATGDFAALEKQGLQDQSPAGRDILYTALLEQGRVSEAAAIRPLLNLDSADAFNLLTFGIAWQMAGYTAQSKAWQAAAVKLLAAGDDDSVRCSELLARAAAPTDAELFEIVLQPDTKAILLTALAFQHPERAAELKAAARRLNVYPYFPFHLIERATAVP